MDWKLMNCSALWVAVVVGGAMMMLLAAWIVDVQSGD